MNTCPELELYEKCGNGCLFGKIRFAFQKMVQDFKAYYPEAEKMTFDNGLANAMQNNGWWENKITEYLQ